jgi:hypothetical protein
LKPLDKSELVLQWIRVATAWQSRFGKPKVMITGELGLIGSILARRLVSFGSDVLVIEWAKSVPANLQTVQKKP